MIFKILAFLWICLSNNVNCMHQAGDNKGLFTGPGYISYSENICAGGTFIPTCSESEVIVIQNATYGRMKLGKCVSLDMGFLGCQKNVVSIAHRLCSGHSSCQIAVPNDQLRRTRPCLELESYLEIHYTCVKVISAIDYPCTPAKILKVLPEEGFISSEKPDSKCGNENTVWLIEAKPGQKVNITLIDYRLGEMTISDPHVPCGSFIRDIASGKEVELCKMTDQRYDNLMVSISNTVEIEIQHTNNNIQSQFLLQYSVIGCPDPPISSTTWSKRTGENIEIGCKGTDTIYTMSCVQRVWTGTYHNCSKVDIDGPINEDFVDLNSLPRGLVITAVLAIALVVGTSIVVVGILMFKRKRPETEDASYSIHNLEDTNKYTQKSYTCPGNAQTYWPDHHPVFVDETQQHAIQPRFDQCYQYTETPSVNNNMMAERRHEYTHIWERPLPAHESQHSC